MPNKKLKLTIFLQSFCSCPIQECHLRYQYDHDQTQNSQTVKEDIHDLRVTTIANSHYSLNFDKSEKNELYQDSKNEHLKISTIARFGREVKYTCIAKKPATFSAISAQMC